MQDGSAPTADQTYNAIFIGTEDDSPIGRIVRRNRLKESFGNLTLLTKPLNSSVSNGPYEGKRAALQEHSLLVLNREISSHEQWDEDTIIARGKGLFEIAKGIWALPAASSTQG